MYIIGGAQLILVYMLVDFFSFLQGPRPPQGATWLRPRSHDHSHQHLETPLALVTGDSGLVARIAISAISIRGLSFSLFRRRANDLVIGVVVLMIGAGGSKTSLRRPVLKV